MKVFITFVESTHRRLCTSRPSSLYSLIGYCLQCSSIQRNHVLVQEGLFQVAWLAKICCIIWQVIALEVPKVAFNMLVFKAK